MKRIFTLLLFSVFLAGASAQTSTSSANTVVEVLQFRETRYDFGKIQQNRPVTHVFEVVNKGSEPIKLDNVQASCGCTTPEWSRDAIQPGGIATIKVGYNAAAEGPFSKTISVQYNGNQTSTIVITGTVYKGPATSAPINSSLSLLKQTNH